MGWWRQKKETEQASVISTLSRAFAEALGGVVQAQGVQIKQSGEFLGILNDLSAKKAAQVLGQRGGRSNAERKRKAKAVAESPSCRLCANPMSKGVTLQEIDEHRRHESQVRAQLEAQAPESEKGN